MKELIDIAEKIKPILGKDWHTSKDNFGGDLVIFDCSYRFARHRLLKHGFLQCPNPRFIKSQDETLIFHSYNANKIFYFDKAAINL